MEKEERSIIPRFFYHEKKNIKEQKPPPFLAQKYFFTPFSVKLRYKTLKIVAWLNKTMYVCVVR